MIYFELHDENSELIYSTIEMERKFDIFSSEKTNTIIIDNYKQFYRNYEFGSVRIIADIDDEKVSTSKIAKRTLDTYSELILVLKAINNEQKVQYSIFSHNLITTHSRLQDEIESIVPENKLARATNYREQIEFVKESVVSDINDVSESIFEIAKRIIDLQAQITGFKVLSGEIKPDIYPQNIKKVLQNIIYPYYDDFKKREIDIKLWIKEEDAMLSFISLDYKLFNIALHHFLNNAVKYGLPKSYIKILYDPKNKCVSFDMMSLKIDENEKDNLFKLNISGKNAQGLAGEGIGMYMIKKSMDLLNARLEIDIGSRNEVTFQDRIYNRNIFNFNFNK